MRLAIFLMTLLLPWLAHGQIYKCVDSQGRTSFSNTTCADPSGKSEEVRVQPFSAESLATPEEIERRSQDIRSPVPRQPTKVTVVRDSTTGSRRDQAINRRLDAREERVRQAQSEGPASRVTVVRDSSRESQLERAARLRREEAALGLTSSPPSRPAATHYPPEINDREVPYNPRQSPLDRRLQQIQNKVSDPRPQDGSTAHCSKGRPSRGVVKVGGKEIWPGMRQHTIRRLIGSPATVNSVLVGQEQWVYRLASGRSLFVYMNGQCVSSIQ